jgi:Ca2+-binding RTX toxin-like protein
MKLFRLVGGTTYRVVGHDGPRTLSGPGLVTFSGISVPVQAGDVLGLNAGTGSGFVQCMFPAPGDTMLYANPSDAADGQEVTFTTTPDRRPNISAVVEPDCDKDRLGDETQDKDISSCAPAAGGATCKGNRATIVGTSGNDVRSGTPGRDVMVGLAGSDRLSGIAGKDLICGGTGKDKLNGGKAKDTLLGQKGRDKLKGGGGKDICKGGKGKDTAACEVEKSI